MTTATMPILARGLAAQLDRVNHSPARLLERIADLERENAHLRQLLKDAHAELISRDDDSLPLVRVPEGNPCGRRDGDGVMMHNNRPAATAAQIARLHGVNISNVYRRLQKNKLQGAVVNGHWIVYTDQAISFKSYRRRV